MLLCNMHQPRIAFHDSHYMPSGLSFWLAEFTRAGIPTVNDDCLCAYGKDSLNEGYLPPIVVVQPSDDPASSCPEAIKGIVQAQTKTKYYIPVLTFDYPTIDRIMGVIGEHDNVDFLCNESSRPRSSNWKDYAETLNRLLEELKAPASR